MDNCLLCLKENTVHDLVKVRSKEWLQLNILEIIEKYFWTIVNLQPDMGICHSCWKQLHDFHKFHKTIEEAHWQNFEIAKEQFRFSDDETYGASLDTYTEVKPDVEFEEERLTIKVNESETMETIKSERLCEIFENGETLNLNERNSTNSVTYQSSSRMLHNERQSVPIETTSMYDNNFEESERVGNVIAKPKSRRGRPRKIHNINEIHLVKPMVKRGRPKKIRDNSEVVPAFNNGRELVIKKQKSTIKPGKRGRPRKKFKVEDINLGFPKKGKRGRPRKLRTNEYDEDTKVANDVVTGKFLQLESQSDLVKSKSPQKTGTEIIEKGSNKRELIYKKRVRMVKKRKRLQQHKALMRNYIATSVRCMSFLKK